MEEGQVVRVPVVELFGDDAIDQAILEIEGLKTASNFHFDSKYIELGISFLNLKCAEILEGTKKHCKLPDLVRESFGEAAIAKFNIGQ